MPGGWCTKYRKDTEEGLEANIKWITVLSVCRCYIFIVAKSNTGAINKIMLDQWDYSCNQNLSYKNSFASTKLWNKIKLHINLYIMGCPFSMYTIIIMYTEILSYSRATNIYWMENNRDGKRAFSSSLLRSLVALNHLPFFKIFSTLVHFCTNFQIFCPF